MQQWDKDPLDPKATDTPPVPRGNAFRKDPRNKNNDEKLTPTLPALQLPKGGGSIRGIDDKFQVNAINGTSSFSIPLPFSPSRLGYTPPVSLGYSSGNGNSPFGLGWNLQAPSITRRTRNYLPKYEDQWESDIFQLSETEDLIPMLTPSGSTWTRTPQPRTINGINYSIEQYVPRIQSSFSRIERWTDTASGDTHWRVLTPDNTCSYYGLTSESRISDPQDPSRVFEWLLCQAQDDKGNLVLLNYKTEDGVGIPQNLCEKNKPGMCTQVYLSSIWYGNIEPFYDGDTIPGEDQFLFRAIFDYGEHDTAQPVPGDIYQEIQPWTSRKDPFSSFRSGFDIRTYRRCSRVLMFHCFPHQELPQNPCLVKSLDMFYDDDLSMLGNGDEVPGFSFLVKATQKGYIWDSTTQTYSCKCLPDMDLTYQQHEWNTQVQEVTPANIAGAPVGVDGKYYRWVDLFSEGIMGILTEQGNAWYYKSNLGGGALSIPETVAPMPTYRGLTTDNVAIRDLEGNGEKYLVQEMTRPQAFVKLSPQSQWCKPGLFEQFPSIDLRDRNSRFLDLNEDGREEILSTEEYQFRWYEGIGEKGFRLAGTVPKAFDEEQGPAVVFADKDQSIFLADMSGDGLVDIVRIRNGEICYWPNLGYGRFGMKVGMDNAPVFDTSDGFNPNYLLLADVDGSGTTDIIYLGEKGFQAWMNISGNAWSPAPEVISPFPATGNDTTIDVLDFLGTGTACIVCSSPYSNEPFRYIDLMGSKKPCVLTGYQNNCGKVVALEYTSSTSFYLADKAAGIPWITKLPFPVQCISKVTTSDLVRESVYTNTYTYRHGFFDPYDKEFRGFAFVEQEDTESFEQFVLNNSGTEVEQDLYQPPVRTRSWFHTGAFLRSRDLVTLLSEEYFQNTAFPEYTMPDPILPQGMDPNDLYEAYRACKSLALRSEMYSDDGTSLQGVPYSTAQSNARIILLQPKGPNRYSSLMVVPSESIAYTYERNPADPRINHSFVMSVDLYGNITLGAAVVYPRVSRPTGSAAIPDVVWTEQDQVHITTKETDFTNDVTGPDVYRLRVACEVREYEIGGLSQPGGFYFSLNGLSTAITGIPVLSYEQDFTGGVQERLYRHSRVYFSANDLSGPLPLDQLASLGIPYNSYQLAFTAGLIPQQYGSLVTNTMLTDARYTHSEGDQDWWLQSGTLVYSATPADDFYVPTGSLDAFGNPTSIGYDDYTMLTVSITDALGNVMSAANDYRILSPNLITDPNGNQSAVQTDELGMTIAIAVMGKPGASEGDTLASPTIVMEYDNLNWQLNGQPNYVHVLARETHGDPNTAWLESYVYSDGGGAVIMTKNPAAPGPASQWNPVTQTVEQVNANPRWVGSGRTILNNKGNPIKEYEPYFSASSGYETESALVATGVSAMLYYDPLSRNIQVDFPNGTFAKVEFDSWMTLEFDTNDTVMDSSWYASLGSPSPTGPEPSDPNVRAAWLAAKDYNTPAVLYSDGLARTFYTVQDYGGGVTAATYALSDFTFRFTNSYDQLSRNIARSFTNLLGQSIHSVTAEKGERWMFTDVLGRMVNVWDNDLCAYSNSYDVLNRPLSNYITPQGGKQSVFAHYVYGDLLPAATAQARNLKGRLYQVYDQAGCSTMNTVDFKGNVLVSSRNFCLDYRDAADWTVLDGLTSIPAIQAAANPLLDITGTFTSGVTVDALNRPVTITPVDGSVMTPVYDTGGGMASMSVNIMGSATTTNFLASQTYNPRGQRLSAQYGNNTVVNYAYDPLTFRLLNAATLQHPADPASQSLQDLNYYYDPVGNITQVIDDAQETRFFQNAVVAPVNKFTYDALYQLLSATGREHAGQGMDTERNSADIPVFSPVPEANDSAAVRNYTEYYAYDFCGNIQSLRHVATGASWTQSYQYQYQVNPADNTNRLSAISLPGDGPGVFSGAYSYAGGLDNGLHGNMTTMPGLTSGALVYNLFDQLTSVNLGGGGTAYYVYGAGGRRMRKVIERQGGLIQERIYMGPVEIYRERSAAGGDPTFERYSLYVSDQTGAFARVDTKTIDTNSKDPSNPLKVPGIRYQYSNLLGSAMLETDVNGQLLSFEEYHPFGTSSYRSAQTGYDISQKRYRFSGKERDEETGLYYFGARYYAAWLGRWISSDPAGFVDGFNVWRYCRNNPVLLKDPNGTTPPPSSFTLGVSKARNGDLKDSSPEAGERLKTDIESHKHQLEGHYYNFSKGSITWEGDHWFYNAKDWQEVDKNSGKELDKGSIKQGGKDGDGDGSAKGQDSGAGKGAGAGLGPGAGGAGKGDGSGGPGKGAGATPGSTGDNPGAGSTTGALAGPVGEKIIWDFPWSGPKGTYRGNLLEWFYGVPWRSNTKDWDVVTDTTVKQLKSTENYNKIAQITRDATRDADNAIKANPSMAGRRPQAVIVTRTDAPASVEQTVANANSRFRKAPTNTPENPELVRGIPGKSGLALKGLTVVGTGLAAYSLYRDWQHGDVAMGVGDALATAGGALEIYAIGAPLVATATGATATAATVAGVSAMSAGIALGGVGIAITSGVSAYREFSAGDYLGGSVDVVGVAAGAAIAAGVVFGAPVVLAAGAVAALGVGLFHLGRWLLN